MTIDADAASGYNVAELTKPITKQLDADAVAARLSLRRSAARRKPSEKAFGGIGIAIIVAIFGIFAILVLEFGNFKSTLIVLTVVPLGVFGGLLMLLFTGNDISFVASIGFVALVGIEIKNSILLVDFTNQLREQGVPLDEAIEQAGEIRFLPILLTSATAIGGLLPLALQNIGLYSPMSWVIIGGLITSTLLARLVTPVMYKLIPPADCRSQLRSSWWHTRSPGRRSSRAGHAPGALARDAVGISRFRHRQPRRSRHRARSKGCCPASRCIPRPRDAEVDERIAGCEFILTNKLKISRARMRAVPGLRFIGLTATGTNNVDLEAARELGIAVCNIRDYCTVSVVQHVLGVMLLLTHRLREYGQAAVDGTWARCEQFSVPGAPIRELSGKVLGIVGLRQRSARPWPRPRATRWACACWWRSVRAAKPRATRTRTHPSAGARDARRTAAQRGCAVAALPADAGDHRHDRQARAGADETRRAADQHRARRAGRSRGAGRGAARWRSRRRGHRRAAAGAAG